jgi:hypothetical protein
MSSAISQEEIYRAILKNMFGIIIRKKISHIEVPTDIPWIGSHYSHIEDDDLRLVLKMVKENITKPITKSELKKRIESTTSFGLYKPY